MKPEALVFLADNPDAQKLATAWPAVDISKRSDVSEWARLAGVHEIVAARLGPVLAAHGICHADGRLDELAARYIAAAVAGTLPKRAGGK